MLSHEKSLNILKKTNALLEGHFILSSGLHSPKYIQCAKLLSFPHLAKDICNSLAKKIKKKFKSIDIILAPAMGGVCLLYTIDAADDPLRFESWVLLFINKTKTSTIATKYTVN
mgnify:CR=1 FL=1